MNYVLHARIDVFFITSVYIVNVHKTLIYSIIIQRTDET